MPSIDAKSCCSAYSPFYYITNYVSLVSTLVRAGRRFEQCNDATKIMRCNEMDPGYLRAGI